MSKHDSIVLNSEIAQGNALPAIARPGPINISENRDSEDSLDDRPGWLRVAELEDGVKKIASIHDRFRGSARRIQSESACRLRRIYCDCRHSRARRPGRRMRIPMKDSVRRAACPKRDQRSGRARCHTADGSTTLSSSRSHAPAFAGMTRGSHPRPSTSPTNARSAARSGGRPGSAHSRAHPPRRSRHTCAASRTSAAPRTRCGRCRPVSR